VVSGKWERDQESGHFLVSVLIIMAVVAAICFPWALLTPLAWWVLLCIEPILAGVAVLLFLGWRGYKK
jgi:hypothetical protein